MLIRLISALKDAFHGKPLRLRSRRWKGVRKSFLIAHPTCAACNSETKLQVHHIKPFHMHPELELEPTNLITLCETKGKKCHLNIGHLGNWKQENPNVINDAAIYKNSL
jgi:5-methylcytosine-specific restriction endonuclease McrA